MEIHSQEISSELLMNNAEEGDLTKNVLIQIRTDLYDKMLAKSRLAPNQQDKALEPGALHEFLNKELAALEKIPIQIQHKSSKLNFKGINSKHPNDFKFFSAHARCIKTLQCPVKYSFSVAKQINTDDYVEIATEIRGKHDHQLSSDKPSSIRGVARVELGELIISKFNGSSDAAREHDIDEQGSSSLVPSQK